MRNNLLSQEIIKNHMKNHLTSRFFSVRAIKPILIPKTSHVFQQDYLNMRPFYVPVLIMDISFHCFLMIYGFHVSWYAELLVRDRYRTGIAKRIVKIVLMAQNLPWNDPDGGIRRVDTPREPQDKEAKILLFPKVGG